MIITKIRRRFPNGNSVPALKSQLGQGLLEYVILVAFIGLVSITATRQFGKVIAEKFRQIHSEVRRTVDIRITPSD